MLVFQHPAKRPDVFIYLNGIALGVLELKRSTMSLAEWTRQVDELNAARAKANKVPA
jgi:type I site-specific restriction-modification system R (restriction) subunit